MQQHAFFLTIAIACSFGPTTPLAAEDLPAAVAAKHQLGQRLGRRVTVAWQGQHLGTVLKHLSETLADAKGLTIWLDRRVDPQLKVEASFTDLPLLRVLEQLTAKYSLGISVLDNIVYVGPVPSARELATLLQRARDSLEGVSTPVRHRWLDKESATWQRLSQPRVLLTNMLEQAGVVLLGSEKIEYDLWDSKQLPRLALVDKVVLVLIGFDLTCQISKEGSSCQVVSIERPVVLSRQYRISRSRQRLLAELPQLVPAALVELKGRTVHVTGRWEDQLKVQEILAGKRPKQSQAAATPMIDKEKSFSLQLKNQAVGGVINQLASQLKLQVRWDRKSLDEANRSQQTLVSCDLKNVPLDELLRGILAPAGMKFRREGKTLEITSAP